MKDVRDKIIFIQRNKGEIVIAQMHIDDIIFGSTKDDLAQDFALVIKNEFKMNLFDELKFFL